MRDQQEQTICILRSSAYDWNGHSTCTERESSFDNRKGHGIQVNSSLEQSNRLRDCAQGAFRMRGIGRGQTIQYFLIPEVLALINRTCGVRDPSTVTHKQMLNNVVAWLVMNSMRAESVQFNMLCEQSIYNVFRRNAFKTLISQSNAYGQVTCHC